MTFNWVTWYNNERLHSYLGNATPEEYEASSCAGRTGPSADDAADKPAA
ncbi:IS3 family transposase [Frondihabitans sp. PhB188]